MRPIPSPISEASPSTTCHALATHTPPNSTLHSPIWPHSPPPLLLSWPLSWVTYIFILV
jgi:hypothetical protein